MKIFVVFFDGCDEGAVEGVYDNRAAAEAHVVSEGPFAKHYDIQEWEPASAFTPKPEKLPEVSPLPLWVQEMMRPVFAMELGDIFGGVESDG